MTDLLFWIFMLLTALLIPGCMIGFGRQFMKNPPKKINDGYGYRTSRSMRSQAAWDFSHAYSGRLLYRMGRPTLAISLVWMVLLFGKDVDTVGHYTLVLEFLQLLPLLAVIPATERALKRELDDFGRKR